MYPYKAPLRDMRFVVHEALAMEAHYRALGKDDLTADVLDGILTEGARFAESVVAPTNEPGDQQGARLENGRVVTPEGFRAAYAQLCSDGWASMTAPAEYGGQELPDGSQLPFTEMLVSGNVAWRTYSGLAEGAIMALRTHASAELQAQYLPKLSSGEWAGTMCLTEAHCGTDLGLIRSRAEPAGDGSYRLYGTKIFITAGDHDLTDNIVHLVLAKLPDAPPGSKGISLFLAPKHLPSGSGLADAINGTQVLSIEHKMGLRGSATCVLEFNGSIGWLVGAPHGGLACMFTMMNLARLGVGVQGLGLAERAFQGALTYARERLQGRAPAGAMLKDKPADPIIVHPDVRRMLLTQKAFVEGSRMLAYFVGQQMDIAHHGHDAETRRAADELLALLTPVVKSFLSDMAVEVTSLGMQVHGGHGYIRDTGMEQLFRDARITPIYEGANGIQALDLMGRKVVGSRGELVKRLATLIVDFCGSHGEDAPLKFCIAPLAARVRQWGEITQQVILAARNNPEEIGAASSDYLQFAGYVCLAWCWARMAAVAQQQLATGTAEPDFYQAKLVTARFFFERLLPRAQAHADALGSGAGSVMQLPAEHFAF